MRSSPACFLALLSLFAAAAPAQQQPPAAPPVPIGNLNLNNVSLTEVVDVLCRSLKLNYILDPRVKGAVTLNTYGETKQIDARNLLELLLRINGATMVQVGEIYRIVPLGETAGRLPIRPQTGDLKSIPDDEQTMLNMVFLKYASVSELDKLVKPFVGEGATVIPYPPANLLFVLDSRRNIRRLMEIIGLFDSDTLARQRVRLFELKNGSPSAVAKELEEVLKAVSLTDRNNVKFMPIDRLNTLIVVAPNPGAFEEVEKWIAKLDTEIKVTVGSIDNYVYRVKYSKAEMLAAAISMLYGGFPMMGGMGMIGGMGMMGGYGGGMGGYGGGMGGYGGGMGGYGGGMGGYGGGMGGYGGMGAGYPGAYGGYGGGMGGAMPYPGGYAPQYPATRPQSTTGTGAAGAPGATPADQTGGYLSGDPFMGGRIPRIIPNPMDNTLLIQATPSEYQQILKLLNQLDISPRQVLIDARIYEVSLTGAFASGVSAYLQKRGGTANTASAPRQFLASTAGGTSLLSAGMLVGASRELLAFLSLAENESRTKVISAPSIIATDSIAASINVGLEVPTLTAQAVTGIQAAGNSLFANSIQSRSTGVTLNVMARVNPSGIVTLVINQDVSAPQAPAAGSIQSPSFSKRSIQTQVTLQDGDTIAIGGIINESNTSSSAGIPVLHRLPWVGNAFGNKSYSRDRSELIVFMTPRVIYDTNQITEASDELKSRLKRLNKVVREE